MLFYTHVSDQDAPLHTKVITANVRDALHVLDGLLYHLSELKIKEHYTDTAGYTEQVFALCHLLGFRFAPRIRDLGETRLYTPEAASIYGLLELLVAQRLKPRLIREHWDELRRLATWGPASSGRPGPCSPTPGERPTPRPARCNGRGAGPPRHRGWG